MNFETWAAAQGYDVSSLTPLQRKHLEAAYKAETAPAVPVAEPVKPAVAADPPKTRTPYDLELEAATREAERRQQIDELTTEQLRANVNHPQRIRIFNAMHDAAISEGWNMQKFQLEMLKAKHTVGPIISVARNDSDRDITNEVIEAATLRGLGYGAIEKKFSDQTLSAVDRHYRRGIGLKELCKVAAHRNNNWNGSDRDLSSMCQAAFRTREGQAIRSDLPYDAPVFRADNGPSTITVPGILSNVANKFLEAGFLYCEQAWRGIARIRQANDYKEMSLYRMGAGAKFEKVPPGGEIKHGTLSELKYTVQVDAYGKMLGISEQDFRNDDLSAFAGVADEIGRGGGDSLNDIFWAEFVADSTFFPTNKSNNNYDDGATDSVLSVAGLDNAETIFRKQTKPDGTPLGVMPSVLLVPAALYNTALQLMGSQGLVVGTTPASGPANNVFFGRYRVVSSVFLDAVATIGSTAWYLLADPMNIATMNLAFLDGIEVPIVETSMFDFDRLGIAMRGTMRFGCKKAEYRGGVKLKGAA